MKIVLINSDNIVENVAVPGDDAWHAAMVAAFHLVKDVEDLVRVNPGDAYNPETDEFAPVEIPE